MNKYRVTKNAHGQFVPEWRPWWFPLWLNCYSDRCGDAIVTTTLDGATSLCRQHENPVVWAPESGTEE
jgi:hypothetical protein